MDARGLLSRLRVPVISAPMFQVSGVELVVAACNAGVIGSFPTANCRNLEELQLWIDRIKSQLERGAAPYCANLIMRRDSLADELACLCENGVELVITSVGSPAPAIPDLHANGCLVFADVASMAHARKAIEAGADGLVLLSAGAGGQTGWANGLAFARGVRRFFDGPVVLAGGVADGHSLLAARALGCDLGYMGTRFLATRESMAKAAHKAMVASCELDDILLTSAFTGLPSSMLKPSILEAGLAPDTLPSDASQAVADNLYGSGGESGTARWADIWSAGHTASVVSEVLSVRELVANLAAEYDRALVELGRR
jgi:nitronate monooxygenase